MKKNTLTFILSLFLLCNSNLKAEDGYRLWLRYDLISNQERLNEYKELIKGCLIEGNSSTINAVENELQIGLKGLLGSDIPPIKTIGKDGIVIASKYSTSYLLSKLKLETKLKNIGSEGFLIFNSKIEGKKVIVITANEDVGVLYGVFHFLRLLQTGQDISNLNIESSPKIKLRLLNHWDNLDRTVERGYAGFSIWDWHRLPEYIDPKYKDYARANASFGIKVYLTARFSAPVEIGGLKTADPFDKDVQQWWRDKAKEIYSFIPDFGGFLVKANSEGQPGPQNYGRSHVDGANMLADALQPFGGVVMWRAFVYDNNVPEDRAKQAYNEFKPFDGKFRNNVLIQAKNGPIDFQPREPFHPLFGALQETPLMMEFQITQEYLGQASHLVYLAPLYKECLESDTYAKGNGSTVARIIDGSLDNHSLTGIAGVSNIGTDRNWTGHLFGQANWFAYGRLSWNHKLSSEEIADEWIRMTFSNDES